MSNFVRANTLGWAAKAKLTSAQANALDIDHAKAINGDNGSSHTPTAPIVILGPNGVSFTCHVAGTWDAAVTFDIGSVVRSWGSLLIGDASGHGLIIIEPGSTFTADPDSIVNFSLGSVSTSSGTWHIAGAGVVTAGGAGHHILGGAKLYVDLGGAITASAGSAVNLDCAVNVGPNAGVWFDASANITGTPTLTQASTFKIASGSTMRALGGAVIQVDDLGTLLGNHIAGTLPAIEGNWELKRNGLAISGIEVLSTCYLTIGAGASFGTNATAAVQFDSAITENGTVIRAGALLRSGNGAWQRDRQFVLGTASAVPVNGTYYDLFIVQAGLAVGGQTVTVDAANAYDGVEVEFVRHSPSSETFLVHADGVQATITASVSVGVSTIRLGHWSGAWKVLSTTGPDAHVIAAG